MMSRRHHRNMTMLKPRHYRQLRGEPAVRRSTILTLAVAIAVGALVGVAPSLKRAAPAFARLTKHDGAQVRASVTYSTPLASCEVTDGDTIKCNGERIRLLGIDAPEMPGHCRVGRDCVPGDPYASTSNLAKAMSSDLTIDRVDTDHYGRTLAMVAGSKGDLSCWQLEHNHAIYKPQWDNELRVARACPGAVL